MLSRFSRSLTYLTAILYTVTGAILFFLPEQSAPVFAWKVTPFMTMTIGGWCLGNAWLAWISARRWEWRLVYTALIYLWLFGLAETLVVLTFRSKLNLANPIAWLYLLMLLTTVLAALVGVIDWLRLRPGRPDFGPRTGTLMHLLAGAFILFVGLLALYGFLAKIGAPGTNGGIFPEVMSLFTLRAFAAFYFSLALAVVPLLAERNLFTLLHHGIASFGLIVMVTLAAFVYLHLFDIVHRPGGLAYFGAYFVVGIPLLFIFIRFGTGVERRQDKKRQASGEAIDAR